MGLRVIRLARRRGRLMFSESEEMARRFQRYLGIDHDGLPGREVGR